MGIKSGKIKTKKYKQQYSDIVESYVGELENVIADRASWKQLPSRWLAIRLIEGDPDVLTMLKTLPCREQVDAILKRLREEIGRHKQMEPDVFMAEERAAFIHGALQETVHDSGAEAETLKRKRSTMCFFTVFSECRSSCLSCTVFFS
ncbi:MAG: hypothetical protein U5N26_10705 [Candidatus Marinimicrobia bacterium]|nr:hypothetical protein [Candidatus Neomarinimicrobiota bacterium]